MFFDIKAQNNRVYSCIIHDFVVYLQTTTNNNNNNRNTNLQKTHKLTTKIPTKMIMSTMTIQEQYNECKKKNPEAIVLFRTNDVYRAYNSDVEVVSSTLGLVCDTIGENEMIQFDCFKLDMYLPKLIRRGHKVAIAEHI